MAAGGCRPAIRRAVPPAPGNPGENIPDSALFLAAAAFY